MKKSRLKPWLILLLVLSTALMFAGAWATSVNHPFANSVLSMGLVGLLAFIILWVVLFGARNRPSNWMKRRE